MSEREPITVEYLRKQGAPGISVPARGILAIISGDERDTVDILPEQVEELVKSLRSYREMVLNNE